MKVTYEFIDTYHCTCSYKRDIITAQLRACEKLIEYSREEGDKSQILSILHMLGLTLLLQPNLSSNSFVCICVLLITSIHLSELILNLFLLPLLAHFQTKSF